MKKDEHNIDFNLFGDYELAGCYIEITSRCNLRCKHCYNESGELRKELDLQAFLNAYDGIPDTEECSITLSGGEPLLHPQVWEFIDRIQKRKSTKNLIITNATLITEDIAKRLVKSGINVQISLNGSCPTTHDKLCGKGNFEKTLSGMDKLLSLGYAERVVVRCMASKYNMDDIVNTIKFVTDRGIKTINIATLSIMGRAKEALNEMYLSIQEKEKLIEKLNKDEEIKRIKEKGFIISLPEGYSGGCPLIYPNEKKIPLSPRIDSKGNVFLCQMFGDEKYAVGNINEQSIWEIIEGEKFSQLIWFLRFGIQYLHKCTNCIWRMSCGKGCVAMILNNGSIQETDGDCHFRKKEFFDKYIQRMSKNDIKAEPLT